MSQIPDNMTFLRMNKVVKSILIFGLILASFSASVFIVLESGEFFQKFYTSDSKIQYMGYWAASLNEIFMAIMAGVWLPNIQKKSKAKIHPLNYFFKILLLLLFITTVAGSSFNLIFPVIDTIQTQKNNQSVINILESQINDNQKSLETFIHQNQRMNSALSVKSQLKIKDELKATIKDKRFELLLWVEVFFIIILRFCIQLANLSCIWLAGWLYRAPTKLNSTIHKTNPLSDPQTIPMKDNHSRPYVSNRKFQEANLKINKKGTVPGNDLNIDSNQNLKSKPRPPKNKLVKKNPEIQHTHQEPKNILIQNGRMTLKQPPSSDRIRKKIAALLKSRNGEISFTDFCKVIEEKESTLRSILSIRTGINEETEYKLPSILKKIENIHAEGQNFY